MFKNLRRPKTFSVGEVHEVEFGVGDTFLNSKHVNKLFEKLAIEIRRYLCFFEKQQNESWGNMRRICY